MKEQISNLKYYFQKRFNDLLNSDRKRFKKGLK